MGRTHTKRALLGAAAFLIFGGGLLAVGGRLVIVEELLAHRGTGVVGTVTHVGTASSDGSDVDPIRYTFEDAEGRRHRGRANVHSGTVGATIPLEYVPAFPFVHRFAGAGDRPAYRLRWWIVAMGLLSSVVGTHGWYVIRDRQRLLARLPLVGASCAGIVRRVLRSRKVVEYEYSAGDGSRHSGRSLALPVDRLDGLDDGAAVIVLYDATRPERSVLELERS